MANRGELPVKKANWRWRQWAYAAAVVFALGIVVCGFWLIDSGRSG